MQLVKDDVHKIISNGRLQQKMFCQHFFQHTNVWQIVIDHWFVFLLCKIFLFCQGKFSYFAKVSFHFCQGKFPLLPDAPFPFPILSNDWMSTVNLHTSCTFHWYCASLHVSSPAWSWLLPFLLHMNISTLFF